MAYGPQDSAIKVTPALEEKLKDASFEEIKEIMKNAAVEQGLAHREWDETIVTPNEPGTVPKGFARTVTINGTKHVVEADSELALEKAMGDLYRAKLQPAATEQQTEQARGTDGRFVAQDDAEAQAAHISEVTELRMQMIRGEITPEEFLTKSGAFDSYLAERGVDMETLQEASGKRIERAWVDATSGFLNSEAGSWWPGGSDNMEKISHVLIEMGATEEPCVENLRRAAEYLRDSGQLIENPEVALQQKIADAQSFSDIVSIMRPGSGGSLFGR
jgi:hypothetical protein